ncbi:phosphonate C-P lyase system protein PhnH [Rubidibacter lacunae KORDI 51-2]|uniref:Phosphonate C-P lyase system protein PhnH n=1 Tax=Rubidibacter lacunae KORDI 51-2 TaxID=582515 RepID=U5DMJ9_9CHRO|nr:phosphonate C-P lyase system protein PhnH [Rubidibacter lacunae]ERN42901.1 phosphonate C-P lyase system protein PhnH [Rubidibacter lacunae KORDI 51-2]
MPTTQLPGFRDPVHDAQRTFRALLDALSRPGIPQTTVSPPHPPELTPSCAAACLTLLDLETQVWLQPGTSEAVRAWLVFHTGCRFTDVSQQSDFALITDASTLPNLDEFYWGSAEYPEASTSLLVQLPTMTGTHAVTLQGPGILETITIQSPLARPFWQQWQAMTQHYPLGLDLWWFAADRVLGLPRTARVNNPHEGV